MERQIDHEHGRIMDLILSLQQFFDLVLEFNMVTSVIVVHKDLFHPLLKGKRIRYEMLHDHSGGGGLGFVDTLKVTQFLSRKLLQEKLSQGAPVDFFQMDISSFANGVRRCDMFLYYCTTDTAILVGRDMITAQREQVLRRVTQGVYEYILYINLRKNSYVPYLLNFLGASKDLVSYNLDYEEKMISVVGQYAVAGEQNRYISALRIDRVRAELVVHDEYVVYASVLNGNRVRDKKLRFIWYDREEDIVLLTCENIGEIQNHRKSQAESQIREQQTKLNEQNEMLRYLELMPVAFSVVQVQLDDTGSVSDYIFTYVNKMRAHMAHYREENMIGCSLLSLFPHLSKIVLDLVYQAAYGEKQMQQQVVYNTVSQRYISYRAYQYSYGYCMVIMEDVTEQVEKDIALEQSQERMRLILGNTVDTVFQYDLERHCIYANQGNWSGQVRLPDMDNVPGSLVEAGYLLASSGILLQQSIDKLVAGDSYVSVTLLARIVLTDTFAWHQLAMTTYIEVHTHKRRILGFLKNIHKTVMEQKRLEQEAMRDSLTRLYNRASGIVLVKKILATQNGQHAFFMFDVDDFKVTNDSYGHEYGDMALRTLADVLRKSFRPSDIVFRVGGDEFSAFVSPVRTVQDADRICRRILKNIGEAKKQGIGLNVSVGVCLGDSSLSYEEYYRKADEALYYIKRQKQGVLDAKYAIVKV